MPKQTMAAMMVINSPLKSVIGAWLLSEDDLASLDDRLVDMGACLPAKRDALLAWPGGFHERANPEAWPEDLRARARSAGESVVSMFMRWLYHIKLVHVPDRPIEAKAYLAVRQAWITPEFVRRMKQGAATAALTSGGGE